RQSRTAAERLRGSCARACGTTDRSVRTTGEIRGRCSRERWSSIEAWHSPGYAAEDFVGDCTGALRQLFSGDGITEEDDFIAEAGFGDVRHIDCHQIHGHAANDRRPTSA